VKRFRGGLVFKAHRLLYHSTLGLRVIKKKTKKLYAAELAAVQVTKYFRPYQKTDVVVFRAPEAFADYIDDPAKVLFSSSLLSLQVLEGP